MNKIIIFGILILTTFSVISCEKFNIEDNKEWINSDPTKANLKIVNAYTSNTPAGASGVGVTRFYAFQDKTKLSGNAIASPGIWPNNTGYASIEPGNSNLFMILDRKVNNVYGASIVGDTAFKAVFNLKAGTNYTAFLVGVSPTQEVITIEDDMQKASEGKYKIRVANLVPSPARPISIYSRREKKMIAINVDYKKVAAFIELPVPSISDTLDVYESSNLSKPIYSLNNFYGNNKRSYTVYANGRTGFRNEALGIYTNL